MVIGLNRLARRSSHARFTHQYLLTSTQLIDDLGPRRMQPVQTPGQK